jgi:hypothetical protein
MTICAYYSNGSTLRVASHDRKAIGGNDEGSKAKHYLLACVRTRTRTYYSLSIISAKEGPCSQRLACSDSFERSRMPAC